MMLCFLVNVSTMNIVISNTEMQQSCLAFFCVVVFIEKYVQDHDHLYSDNFYGSLLVSQNIYNSFMVMIYDPISLNSSWMSLKT